MVAAAVEKYGRLDVQSTTQPSLRTRLHCTSSTSSTGIAYVC